MSSSKKVSSDRFEAQTLWLAKYYRVNVPNIMGSTTTLGQLLYEADSCFSSKDHAEVSEKGPITLLAEELTLNPGQHYKPARRRRS